MSTAVRGLSPQPCQKLDPLLVLVRALDRHCRQARSRGQHVLARDLRQACQFLEAWRIEEQEAEAAYALGR